MPRFRERGATAFGGLCIGFLPLAASLPAASAELPVACVAGSCGSISTFVTSGAAAAAIAGNTLTVTQTTDSAVMNWQSFNISSDGRVDFVQPDSASIALNRIFQANPSQIFGALNSNGRVYLLNQNGIVFGSSATVDVAGLVASSLNLTPTALSDGLLAPAADGQPAFTQYIDALGSPLPSGAIRVEQGASIKTTEGGSVLMFAPEISNAGTISTPGGQTLLAAGTPVYLVTSADANLRGLMVEVGVGGTVTNGVEANANVTDPTQLVGQIVAQRGNVTLAGLAVNQQGRVSATTSVTQNGSVYLQARDGGSVVPGLNPRLLGGTGGNLTLARNSVTDIALDDSGGAAVDATSQPASMVNLDANRIVMESGARIVAAHGNVTLTARNDSNLAASSFGSGATTDSRIYLAPDASIDVSGVEIERSMESNVIKVELRGTELADSPVQQDGALRSETVYIDTRLSGTREDGSTWVGSPIGDLSGWVETIQRDVYERNLAGGTVSLYSQGDVILANNSTIDVSGGAIDYQTGYINTTLLVGSDGKLYEIGSADRERSYTAIANSGSIAIEHPRWGVTEIYAGYDSRGRLEPGYVEGKDAGTINISGQRVVLDGDLQAATVSGRYQRLLPQTVDATALYRPYDQLPLSGQLRLGNVSTTVTGNPDVSDFQLESAEFFASGAQPVLSQDFDPWTSVLADSTRTLQIRSELFGEDRVGRLTVRANDSVELPVQVSLQLPTAGAIDIAAGQVNVAGQFTIPSGSIELTATGTVVHASSLSGGNATGGLQLVAGSLLDVSGRWVNDTAAANGGVAGAGVLAIDGGEITLTGDNQAVILDAGTIIDASGGAQLTAAGKLIGGTGGTITLGAGPFDALVIGGELHAEALYRGGDLNLTGSAFCITGPGASCLEDARSNLTRLTPRFFTEGGFASFEVVTNFGGVEIAPGTVLDLAARNLLPSEGITDVATGARLRDIATEGVLDETVRGAVDLSLTVNAATESGLFDSSSFAQAPDLVVGSGAQILGDIGARIQLESNTRLLVDGTIAAPAGSISLVLNQTLPISGDPSSNGYFASQGIWLGDEARLLATGATRLLADDLGRINGDVLSGGVVSISARRGHVLTSAGSLIDVSGTAALVDKRSDSFGRYERTTVGSAAGSIDLSASEAIVLGGTLLGQPGSPGVAGGQLSVTLNPVFRADSAETYLNPYTRFPDMPRTIVLSQSSDPVTFADSVLPQQYQGQALLSADQVNEGGFDALELTAYSFNVTSGMRLGRILLSGDLTLELARSLSISSASLESTGGTAILEATQVQLGYSDEDIQQSAPLTSGEGTLTVRGQVIDVVGTSVLQGFREASLAATGDLRFIGVVSPTGTDVTGSLATAGSLTLSGSQLYPTTLTQFAIDAGQNGSGTLTITRPATVSAAEALSAGGQLTLTAPSIVQAGTLRAPFGAITFNSPAITLTDGSVTSTSGTDSTVLFGSTQGGVEWVYDLGNGERLVFNAERDELPSQQINLNGTNVTVADGAVLDARGGGTLLAYEFVSGTTGTVDWLSGSDGSFAIVPQTALATAPYDLQIGSGSFDYGTSVYLDGFGDLPAGTYVVVPARYALLPGGYLVRNVTGYQDITAGEQYAQFDGSTVVSGYFTTTGTTLRDSRTSGFAVLSGAALKEKTRYDLTSADDYFSEQAVATGVAAERLPRDAGTVAILANVSLELDGTLLGAAGDGGRGAALDIGSASITVVANGSPSAAGGLTLQASDLQDFGAESILLGGTRSDSSSGIAISTISSNVTVAEGAALSAPELLFVASDEVKVASGATLTGAVVAGLDARDVSLTGDGALLRVAGTDVIAVSRSGTSGSAGLLTIGQGATLTATGGGINLESTNTAQLEGTIAAAGGSLSVTGNQISLGAVGDSVTGIVLSNSQLQNLNRVVLHSRSSIDLYGVAGAEVLALGGENVTLEAQALRSAGGDVRINASGTLAVSGVTDGVGTVGSLGASGNMALAGGKILIGGGDLAITDFTATSLAAGEIRGVEDAALVFTGAASLSAQRLSVSSGRTLAITAAGSFAFSANGNGSAASGATSDLGGTLSIDAASVDVTGRIVLPSGVVKLTSTVPGGRVRLGEGANIDVSGIATDFQGEQVYSGGGLLVAIAGGDLEFMTGSAVNVSGAGTAAAGSLDLRAASGTITLNGSLSGSASQPADSGSVTADALQLPSVEVIANLLRAGGMFGDIKLRQRGSGALGFAADNTLEGTTLSLVADAGSIDIAGTLRAHGPDGGRIALAARDGISISGTLDARAAEETERNGQIDLQVGEGGLTTGSTATLATVAGQAAAGQAADGQISIRLPEASLLTLLDADTTNDTVSLAGNWANAGRVEVEGFRVYVDADGTLDATETAAVATSPIFANAEAFAAQAAALGTALNQTGIAALSIVPGIEIRADADLTLSSDWSLTSWHFNGLPGGLTLRAGGNLTFNQSLSDGFANANSTTLNRLTGDSWSYRLVAGADLQSADILATVDDVAAGNLQVAAGDVSNPATGFIKIRTGTGGIDIRAAGDVTLGNSASVIYTAGLARIGTAYADAAELGGRRYPYGGGDVTVVAGRDVIGAESGQLVTDWLWRVGNINNSSADTRSTAWTVAFDSFQQNIGALGGGDVSISAGRNVDSLSASAPTIGFQNGGTDPAQSQLSIDGGGNVTVTAGNDILGGTYFSGRGLVSLVAGGEIGASSQSGLNPVLALGDASAVLLARNGVTLQAVVNPTLVPQASSQNPSLAGTSVFASYGANSKVALTSLAGDITFANALDLAETGVLPGISFVGGRDASLRTYPGQLEATALRGDIEFEEGGGFTLFPSEQGYLSLRAYRDINIASGVEVIVSDVNPSYLPTIAAPQSDWTDDFEQILTVVGSGSLNFNAGSPVRLPSAQNGSLQYSRIVAQTGDINQTNQSGAGGNEALFYFGAPVGIYAGRDILDLNVIAQNLLASDITSIVAGRDVRYTIIRDANGGIADNNSQISVDGPGLVSIEAGRDVNLQNSAGVTTRGSLRNPALSGEGAAVDVVVGLAGRSPDYAAFTQAYIRDSETYTQELKDYIEQMTGVAPATHAEAVAAFESLGTAQQAPLLRRVLLAELRASGRYAASSDPAQKDDYSDGYRALETLFPGANPDLLSGETSPYSGDLNLYFSRIYTLAGGDITLLAPGGGVNAGLSTPPSAFGVAKGASELGIVVQRTGSVGVLTYDDLQVNESRVFAADGGDILVWATQGDIDAGRGAKTAISAPPPTITIDANGNLIITLPATLTGSGIQTLATSRGTKPGDVDLFAPRGVVNAGDAGIVAGNLTIGATAVLGADNISVSGVAVGVPVDAGGLGASLAGVSSSASSASNSAATSLAGPADNGSDSTPLAEAALSFLEVFVIGLGDENCRPDDLECLKRQGSAEQ